MRFLHYIPRRFSLKLLLLATVGVCIWLGYLSYQVRQQQEAIAFLETIDGAQWHFDYELKTSFTKPITFYPLFDIKKDATLPGPAWLCNTVGKDYFRTIKTLSISSNELTDEQVTDIFRLSIVRNIDYVCIDGNGIIFDYPCPVYLGFYQMMADPKAGMVINYPISDECLKHVCQCKHLTLLNLYGKNITDNGMKHLSELSNLKVLSIKMSQITDESLKTIGQLPNLEVLTVRGTNITGEGFVHLYQSKKLKYVKITGEKPSEEKQIELEKRFPREGVSP